MNNLTAYKIKTDLLPVIRRAEHFDLPSVQMQVRDFLSDLLRLDERVCGHSHKRNTGRIFCLMTTISCHASVITRWCYGR